MFSEFLLIVTGPGKTSYQEHFNCNLALGFFLFFFFSFEFKLDKVKMFMSYIIASGRLEIAIDANHCNNW